MTGMMMSLLLIFASKRAMGFPWWPRRLLFEKVTFSRLVAGSRLRAAVRTFSSLSVAWANRLISTDAMGGALGNFGCALFFCFCFYFFCVVCLRVLTFPCCEVLPGFLDFFAEAFFSARPAVLSSIYCLCTDEVNWDLVSAELDLKLTRVRPQNY